MCFQGVFLRQNHAGRVAASIRRGNARIKGAHPPFVDKPDCKIIRRDRSKVDKTKPGEDRRQQILKVCRNDYEAGIRGGFLDELKQGILSLGGHEVGRLDDHDPAPA